MGIFKNIRIKRASKKIFKIYASHYSQFLPDSVMLNKEKCLDAIRRLLLDGVRSSYFDEKFIEIIATSPRDYFNNFSEIDRIAKNIFKEISSYYTNILPKSVCLVEVESMKIIYKFILRGENLKNIFQRLEEAFEDDLSLYFNGVTQLVGQINFYIYDSYGRGYPSYNSYGDVHHFTIKKNVINKLILSLLLQGNDVQSILEIVCNDIESSPQRFYSVDIEIRVSSKGALGYDRLNIRPERRKILVSKSSS